MEDRATLLSKKKAYKDQKAGLEKKNKIIDQELEELQDAYDAVKAAKEEYELIKKDTKKTVNKDYVWRGNTADTFSARGQGLINGDKGAYENIDDTLDAISKAITDKKKERTENLGIISKLLSWLYSIEGKLRELGN